MYKIFKRAYKRVKLAEEKYDEFFNKFKKTIKQAIYT